MHAKALSTRSYLRLKSSLDASGHSDAIDVSEVQAAIRRRFSPNLSHVEIGRIVRKAFPQSGREKRGSSWVYTGIRKRPKITAQKAFREGTARVAFFE